MRLGARLVCAALASFVALWACAWLFLLWVSPDQVYLPVLLIVEVVLTAFAQYMWVQMAEKGPEGHLPLSWIGVFVVSGFISALFVEIDCFGTLHFIEGRPICTKLGGGISIIFTLGAIAGALVALPLALRSWVLKLLDAKCGDNETV